VSKNDPWSDYFTPVAASGFQARGEADIHIPIVGGRKAVDERCACKKRTDSHLIAALVGNQGNETARCDLVFEGGGGKNSVRVLGAILGMDVAFDDQNAEYQVVGESLIIVADGVLKAMGTRNIRATLHLRRHPRDLTQTELTFSVLQLKKLEDDEDDGKILANGRVMIHPL
jgi:hypothetical protein